MKKNLIALDLFAGTGWGVACQRLGIEEMGVEIMPDACATREANGMRTIFHDVWEGLEVLDGLVPKYDILIGSPPCQTFSTAGNGAGRAALNEVLEAIELHTYKDPELLREFGATHDDRTALVLTPLAYINRDRPQYVTLEQVPPVLPVWEAYAEVMAGWGYDVKTAILNAEQYGVPQTRRRAILVARLGGPVELPTHTHSRYYSREPKRLDPGVLPWVSMAQALGWGDEGTAIYHGVQPNSAKRLMTHPSATIAFGHDAASNGFASASMKDPDELKRAKREGGFDAVSIEEASVLQSYPIARKNMRKGMVERYGERPGQAAGQPAFTLRASAGGTEPGRFVLQETECGPSRKPQAREVATLQTYEKPFVWKGTKSSVFLQIGNAVPPLLAQAVLSALLKDTDDLI